MSDQYRVMSTHFAAVKRRLQEYSKHFDIAAHGDIKGYGREALVNEFLRTHLPAQLEFFTGEVLDPTDRRSGQVDIILQSRRYPQIPIIGNVHLAFVDAVIAIIEVKSDLNKQHLKAALGQFQRIKKLKRRVKMEQGPTATPLPTIPCLIFAFKGPEKDTLIKSINEYGKEQNVPLDAFAPDLVVVLGSDYYICKNDGWQFPVVRVPGAYFRHWGGLPHENLVGMYNYLNNVIQAHERQAPGLLLRDYFDKSVVGPNSE
jgi:hypothetical protein